MALKATLREGTNRGNLRRLRRDGQIPGVVYGKSEQEPLPVAVNAQDLQSVLKTNAHAIVELQIDGYGKRNVLIADLQRDHLTQQVLHIDFHTIRLDEIIRSSVRLEVSGKSEGEKEGGMLQLVLHELEVECLPKNLPDSIVLDVSGLQIGDTLIAADLKLPEGVKTTVDPETVVVAILAPQKETADGDAESADAGAEKTTAAAVSADRA